MHDVLLLLFVRSFVRSFVRPFVRSSLRSGHELVLRHHGALLPGVHVPRLLRVRRLCSGEVVQSFIYSFIRDCLIIEYPVHIHSFTPTHDLNPPSLVYFKGASLHTNV